MNTISWITSLIVLFNYLPCPKVTAQYGTYYDRKTGGFRFYKARACRVRNLYYGFGHHSQFIYYTKRHDVDCCYLAATRNLCCVKNSYDWSTSTFSSECRCSYQTNCGNTVITTPTTTTTTTTTTTLKPVGYCPAPGGRILNSKEVFQTCGAYPGVFPLTRDGPLGRPLTICNAVLAQAYVKGVKKTTLVTAEFCLTILKAAQALKTKVFVQVPNGGAKIPLEQFQMIAGNDGAGFLDTAGAVPNPELLKPCNKIACGLREEEMRGKINYDDCMALSYGSFDASTLAQKGLRQIPVRIYPQGCRSVYDFGVNNTVCFVTKSLVPILCSGDYGAPVFCKTSDTAENVVVGVLGGTADCGKTPIFRVIRYPAY